MLAIRNPIPGSIADLHGRLGRDRRTSQKFYSLTGREDPEVERAIQDSYAAILRTTPTCAAEAIVKVEMAAEMACLEFGDGLGSSSGHLTEDEDCLRVAVNQLAVFFADFN